jgi:hypothetical protein
VRPQNPLALEADLLGDALRRVIVGIRDQIDPLKPTLVERVATEQTERPRARAPSTRPSSDPIAEPRAVLGDIESDPDPADDISAELDGQRVVIVTHLAPNERPPVVGGIRVRDRRDPARDLGVVAPGDHRVDVVLRPRPQNEIALAQLHTLSLGRAALARR